MADETLSTPARKTRTKELGVIIDNRLYAGVVDEGVEVGDGQRLVFYTDTETYPNVTHWTTVEDGQSKVQLNERFGNVVEL